MVDTPIVSEALQKTFRDNFPSQINSGRDLHVSDVILPIVDFSSTAGTSGLDTSLQQAITFGNQTVFDVTGIGSTTIINTTGFYRVFGVANVQHFGSGNSTAFVLNDGSTDKKIWQMRSLSASFSGVTHLQYDFIVFLATSALLKIVNAGGVGEIANVGSTRQLADISGTLTNPTGYTGS